MAVSDGLETFGTTIFSVMMALAQERNAINLGQGFPNWDAVGFVEEAAAQSMVSWVGMIKIRQALVCQSSETR